MARAFSGPIWNTARAWRLSLGLALGYGRERAGRVGTVSASMLTRFSTANMSPRARASRRPVVTYTLACTQHHWSMEGRPAVREFNLAETLEAKENIAEEEISRG